MFPFLLPQIWGARVICICHKCHTIPQFCVVKLLSYGVQRNNWRSVYTFFLRSWYMYVLAFYVHIQLQLFNPQWNVLITLRACSRGKVHAIGRVVIMSKNLRT